MSHWYNDRYSVVTGWFSTAVIDLKNNSEGATDLNSHWVILKGLGWVQFGLYSYEWFTKSDDGKVGVRFVHLECDYSRKRIRRHDVLLQINQNYDRIEKTT